MKLISQLINNRKERIQRSMQRKETLLQDEYAERVQAKEYNGKMYIAIDGIPFIQADNIKADIVLQTFAKQSYNTKPNNAILHQAQEQQPFKVYT